MELKLLSSPIIDPLTIQLYDQEKIPFKVIVQCESHELALSAYQRPITKDDKFLFEFINNRNLKHLASDIQDFKVQLEQEYNQNNQENFLERYEATCKIFLGTQFLKTSNKKRKQENYLKFQTQQIQNQEYQQQSRVFQGTQNIAQLSQIGTLRDQNQGLLQVQNFYESKSKKTLVCGVYENENLSQIEDFIRSFRNQDIDLVILCNGLDSLERTLRQKLLLKHEKQTLITIEIDKNQYSVNNALVLQYQFSENNLQHEVIFVIKYFKSSNYDIQRWLYNGIGKHFDPDFFYVTQCSLIQSDHSINTQLKSIKQKNLCAITCSILQNNLRSWNPLNPINALLLEQTLDHLENISTNNLFSVVLDHNPFFCFYDWQKIKQFIDLYLQKIIKSECDYVQNIIVQGENYILPSLAAEQGLLFGRSDKIVAQASCNDSLSKIMNQQRKRKNSKASTHNQFLETYSTLSSTWKINLFIRLIQQIALKTMHIHSSLNNYFGISAIIFIFAQSSYDFFGNAFGYYYFYILQLSIPALFIFSVVTFLIFAILFRSQYKIARAKGMEEPIIVSGDLVFYLSYSPLTNSCSYCFENSTIKKSNKQLDPRNVQFVGSSPNNQVMSLYLYYGKQIYLANQLDTNTILQEIINLSKIRRQQGENKNQNGVVEYFSKIKDCKDICFNYQNTIGEAAEQYKTFYHLIAIFNLTLIAIFTLNIIFNYCFHTDQLYRWIICICILMVILEKTIKILLHLSHIPVFVRGYLSYIFYYLIVNFGMKFYERINTDNNIENEKIKEFYYNKVQSFALWISYNIVFLFICFMVEAYYDFCGYVLLFFLSYFAISSLGSIIFTVISKFLCFNLKNHKKEDNESQNNITEFRPNQFLLEGVNYEKKFLKIQQEANLNFYKLQEHELQQERKEQFRQQPAILNQTIKFWETVKINMPVIPDITEEFEQKTQSLIDSHQSELEDKDSMMRSNDFGNLKDQQIKTFL
ncbi:unnamed protein product (macronuclear) [Paramecium tetraurelia]|uniref:Transmembrane protein n=1 Tax=Paramecium tetraurelia TaxID=5888 RepID=A0DET6_PARTE|nr:uncharacterized protein GSPATT00016379001 [Paramecium tetraurelia]CAK81553.1 unnamed protein product [Paramecium tetraurelia]|eukprot:XP_001448950.1 hypothetical protein (macronuclear) [Paramecium tetraurelia strain d4-2]